MPEISQSFVLISRDIFNKISLWAEEAYPHEGCGLLIGRFQPGGGKEAERFAPLSNQILKREALPAQGKKNTDEIQMDRFSTLPLERQGPNAGRTEFVMSPEEFNRETLAAEKQGLDVIGIIHTHPDHPPRPSQIDASQPFLAQWSNIIVAVEKGRTKEMKSWFRETDAEPFKEEIIKVNP